MARARQPVGRVTGPASYDKLRVAEQDARQRSLEALSHMRSKGLPLTAAARAAGTTPATVKRYADTALTRDGRRYNVTPVDRIYRRMAVLTAEGRQEVDVRSSKQASRVGAHWNAVDHYLRTGDPTKLTRFTGVTIGGHVLATHTGDLETYAHRGELAINDIYPHR